MTTFIILSPFILGFMYGMYLEIKKILDCKALEREQLENSLGQLELEYIENQKQKEKKEEEIELLKINIERRQTIAYQLELELEFCEDMKRKQAILSKLISLDQRGFKDKQRLYKLLEDLEL